MNDRTSTFDLHFRRFLDSLPLHWFGVGVGIGLLGWRWGASVLPVWAFKITSGFNGILVMLLLAASILALLTLLGKGRMADLAYGDFLNAVRWGIPGTSRATSVLAGVVVVATICWWITGSGNALRTALMGMLLAAPLLWFRSTLLMMADELAKRHSQHEGGL